MFSKLLIANRGEIACRVMRTAKRLGIRTVAVYSDADVGALHVALADEAIRIGPPPALESYLSAERIIAAARSVGADAIHPGYGFLSENADFAEAVEAAGITFVGPSARAIRAMGLKDAAKALMELSGVPVVPGYHGERQEAEFLAEEAANVGYPVLIKARAGGGGKGMRRVDSAAEFPAALEAARREAEAAFGDGSVLIEKYLTKPRHIEVQVFGDRHGNILHLYERDCSLQRRHQKVIEEAPAPGMTAEVRHAMGDAAVRAAQAIGYVGAGTVEFIADVTNGLWPDQFYFMEMNTRLQVEHPVTEAITGIDLVEWQLRAAAGEALPKRQSEIGIDGWAFEARIYAEDPSRGFLPATGRLTTMSFPEDGVRVDAGVRQGDRITPFYDPLIAKLIVHGPNRSAALAKLENALRACRIGGTITNLDFLARLAAEPDFRAGHPDTGLIDRSIDQLTATLAPSDAALALAAIVSTGALLPDGSADPWTSLGHWQIWSDASRNVTIEHTGGRSTVTLAARGRDQFAVHTGTAALPVVILDRFADGARAEISGAQHEFRFLREGEQITLFLNGESYVLRLPDALGAGHSSEVADDEVSAPMPGIVKLIRVRPGDTVEKGQPLAVMEAMKMELTLSASRAGVVESVLVSEGEQVTAGAVLVMLQPESAE
ncbi:acetyl/propionyl/methylcrotonyl-CoA carboxylase subunit alpha [Ensifer adhaerens]|uniref:acetyl/propionyl/methylcrotonyl-CoA carboxylase subunit alpha n=1 Tax=Ensifer adhaerens TaxID=106592 RepID=UPI001CBDE794|nr:acetyl/propionyl/methylcrotonyl-CoA carboxylase subunit alpha [Ensifer adhaerens]MBZ7925212.1 acetyl/propionyl/methylcrotonyl-CoA carboxylase subunit alpha [Ensifer adhaerens]UAX95607.1 acetyl/propionyl/methylcrotonyl-CoA carboxylase subunit alpha [Ensifer adhaerens]UAY02501.1 acetyl/propionyl/methylcrotonyl-CoA carboxylase subunit alpha [Ensifer adhaerens]UAY10485.1 acetyl/propionyl/methylcrotonyl-CoA carboxylase subunit alpha [Ensifer adhaerens]